MKQLPGNHEGCHAQIATDVISGLSSVVGASRFVRMSGRFPVDAKWENEKRGRFGMRKLMLVVAVVFACGLLSGACAAPAERGRRRNRSVRGCSQLAAAARSSRVRVGLSGRRVRGKSQPR